MTEAEKASIRDLLKTADINLSERQTNILCRAWELSLTKMYEQGLAEGSCKLISNIKVELDKTLAEENETLKKCIKNLVNAFNEYECAGPLQEQENTWEILQTLMHEELYKMEGKTK